MSSGSTRLLDILEAEAPVVDLSRGIAALVGVGVHVHGERLDVTCQHFKMILRRVSNRGPTVTHISALLKFQSILLYVFEDIPDVFLKPNIFKISPPYSFENQSGFRGRCPFTGHFNRFLVKTSDLTRFYLHRRLVYDIWSYHETKRGFE